MPEQQSYMGRNPDQGILAVAGALGAGGLALILWAIFRGKEIPLAPIAPLTPGEVMGRPTSSSLMGAGTIQVRRGEAIPILDPVAEYSGPGRDTFTICSVVQLQGTQWVTVYGSGIAGVHVGPTDILQNFHLVSLDQLEPEGCPAQALCLYMWPGVQPGPICGAPPIPGHGTVVLEVYEKKTTEDADGFASPTCNTRYPVQRQVWNNKVLFE